MNFQDPNYFPKNYHDSRERVANLIEKTKAKVIRQAWPVPSKVDNDLYVDLAYFPPSAQPKFLFFLSSGIHGAETYAGSAIQQMFLTEFFSNLNRENLGVVIVHCMNPYGFKHHVRTTENGVNLNRNFSVSGELFKSKNQASELMHQKFIKSEPVNSPKSFVIESMNSRNGATYFGDIPMDEFKKAVSSGQHVKPEHLEFGGRQLEPQSLKLVEFLKEVMPQYQDVLALDLHTGLGDKNRLHLLTSGVGKDLNPDLYSKLFKPDLDKEYYTFTPAETKGFYQVFGALNCAFADLCQKEQRICAITMEFGTLGHDLEAQLEGMNNFVLEHQGKYNGYASAQLEEVIKKESFERSYPQNDHWRSAVIAASRGLFKNVFKRAELLGP